MKQWYCYVRGQQYGPVSEEVLRRWAAEGRVGPTDRVWTDGMADWAAAGTVEGLFPAGAGGAAFNRLLECPPPGGTRGQTPNSDLTRWARDLLRGNWGLPIGFSILLWLLGVAVNCVPYVGGLASLIVAGAFELSGVIFYITFVRRGHCQLGMLFAGFRAFGRALGVHLLVSLLAFLWSLPAGAAFFAAGLSVGVTGGSGGPAIVVPLVLALAGSALLALPIIALLSYSQAMYLLADDPTLGPLQAIRRSKAIMSGRKGKLFCLGLRFLCWWLVVVSPGVLVGIVGLAAQNPVVAVVGMILLLAGGLLGLLFLVPYINACYALFYDDLGVPAAAAVVEQSPGGDGAAPPVEQTGAHTDQ